MQVICEQEGSDMIGAIEAALIKSTNRFGVHVLTDLETTILVP